MLRSFFQVRTMLRSILVVIFCICLLLAYVVIQRTIQETNEVTGIKQKICKEMELLRSKYPSQPSDTWTTLENIIFPAAFNTFSHPTVVLFISQSSDSETAKNLARSFAATLKILLRHKLPSDDPTVPLQASDYISSSIAQFSALITHELKQRKVVILEDIQYLNPTCALTLPILSYRWSAPSIDSILICTVSPPRITMKTKLSFRRQPPAHLAAQYLAQFWGKHLSVNKLQEIIGSITQNAIIVQDEY